MSTYTLDPNYPGGRPIQNLAQYKWMVVGMLWFITFFNYADRMALSANLPLVGEYFGLSDTQRGMLVSAFGYSYGMAAIFAGYIVDRVRRKSAVLFGLLIWSLICIMIGAAPSYHLLFLFLALEGLGEAFYFPAALSLVSDYHGKATRSRAMSINQTAVYFGTVGGTVAAAMLGGHFNWRAPFFVFGALGVVLALVLWRFLHEPARGAADLADAGEGGKASHRKIGWIEFFRIFFTTPTAPLLLLGFLFANSVAAITLGWMPSFILESFYDGDKTHLVAAGFLATLPLQFASMIAAPMAGLSADKFRARTSRGRIMVQCFGAACAIPFVVLCGQADTKVLVIVALVGWGICKGIYDSNIFASLYDVIRPEARGMAAGIMNLFAWAVAGVVGPIAFGYFSEIYGKRDTMSYSAALYGVAAILLFIAMWFFVGRDSRRMQAQLVAEADAQRT
ncbi:MAG: MFS transporter [FCB group bacterium]|jgi:MFS family permease|nr:MFS transporter [FCB group bacterium]